MSPRRLTPTGLLAALTLGPVLGAALTLGTVVPSYAEVADCKGVTDPTALSDPATTASVPVEELSILDVHERLARMGRTPGEGIGVAVLDSGIVDSDALPQVADERVRSKEAALSWWRGTTVAGLIAGRPMPDGGLVGVAPAARLVDLRVYDAEGSDELETPSVDGVVAGLDRVVALATQHDIRVVTVAFPVERNEALDAAVRAVTAAGIIVVAASGDRLESAEGDDDGSGPDDGENAAREVWPAGYSATNPLVLSVSTTAPSQDGVTYALQSSAIDVAVPTAGSVSYAINGETCTIAEPSTSWAAAEVSGILTLVMSAYPDDTPQQVLARLEDTATGSALGNGERPNRRTGRGIVQPLAAIERVIAPSKRGDVAYSSRPERGSELAVLPVPEKDQLAGTRREAIWWGLGGGGALLVAMLLRPVLARRRPRS